MSFFLLWSWELIPTPGRTSLLDYVWGILTNWDSMGCAPFTFYVLKASFKIYVLKAPYFTDIQVFCHILSAFSSKSDNNAVSVSNITESISIFKSDPL